jgi:hypothetical protein
MRYAGAAGAVGSPLAALAAGLPWWAYLAGTCVWASSYIYRQYVFYRLGSRALERAEPAQIPAVITAITRTETAHGHRHTGEPNDQG